ncbi:hypothetical protein P153DRAFT_372404 [Dothidotthia symphoricarpi CBS 119687]|uniref:Uncharacterized protein n=1 Tax=Dothidotthia symphoricarpi CBS 119687 TaxID=1392245 RepID=A0A6A6APD2_9PLEO|nr:uncharacterized protein P153DRAFT_372404 [Dothidotthia symphoricarpi CBS 119687]KAF2133852.1 hypothetical protein P153DRAFT_372404 [Dothidotthia symphoricarpi CBS 119687]
MADSTVLSEPFPPLLDSTTPIHEFASSPLATPYEESSPKYDEPLYTEINIPLPHIRSPPPKPISTPFSPPPSASLSPPPRGRSRSTTLSSLSPFRRSSSSTVRTSDEQSRHSEEWPRIRKDIVKSREIAAAMNLGHRNKRTRSGTIDALAVVPAVLILSAELFTPGQDDQEQKSRKDSGVGRWGDGIR